MEKKFYLEIDPNVRLDMVEMAILNGEDVEKNTIRKEILLYRYDYKNVRKDGTIPDNFLQLWMALEFNKNPKGLFGGTKTSVKAIKSALNNSSYSKIINKGELYKSLLEKECYHLVCLYIELCKEDRSYNSLCFGLMQMKKENTKNKIYNDLKETGIELPRLLKMENDLELIVRATKKALNNYID